jgi:hypothetical protein
LPESAERFRAVGCRQVDDVGECRIGWHLDGPAQSLPREVGRSEQ